jgi:hypothetical protein
MSVLTKIAFFRNRHDEIPNQELAQELAGTRNVEGIREIAENLWNKNPNVQSDCLKVLYEVGYIEPALITDYSSDFLRLLQSKNNRLKWGGMIAIATIAALKADEFYKELAKIRQAVDKGSVITVDNGIKALAAIAAQDDEYRRSIFPYLIHHLQTCRAKDVPQHAEKIQIAVDAEYERAFIEALEKRMPDLSPSQAQRVKKVIRAAEHIGK